MEWKILNFKMIPLQPFFSAWAQSKTTIQNDTGAYYQDHSGCSKPDCWIQYAGAGGGALRKEDDSWSRGCGDVSTWMVCPKTNAPRKTCKTFQTYRET